MKNVHRCFFPALLLLLTLTLALPVRARGTEGLVLLDTGTVREMLSTAVKLPNFFVTFRSSIIGTGEWMWKVDSSVLSRY